MGWFTTLKTGRQTDAMRQSTSESEKLSRKRRFETDKDKDNIMTEFNISRLWRRLIC